MPLKLANSFSLRKEDVYKRQGIEIAVQGIVKFRLHGEIHQAVAGVQVQIVHGVVVNVIEQVAHKKGDRCV